MKNLTGKAVLLGITVAFISCGDSNNGSQERAASDSANTGLVVADPSATSLIKRGMVVVQETPRKLRGSEREKDAIYRFHPFDNDQQSLRLTTADNNAGKGIAEEQEIDLSPYANRMIEVQGSSFGNRWVYNAKINGVVIPDTAAQTNRAATDTSSSK